MITIKQLQEHFEHDEYLNLMLIKWIINDEIDIELIKQIKDVQRYIDHCYNMPNDLDIKMFAIDLLLQAFGIETINDENVYVNHYWQNCIALYINVGESYMHTIVYDTQEKEFILTTYADFIEKHEKRVDK